MNITDANILLVDDEEDVLEFMSYILKKEGARITIATNGREAIEKAQETIPHLILIDKMMPIMNGVEACEILRKNSVFDHTKIVFLSARSDADSQIEGLDKGADDYLAKPIKTDLLLSKIRAILRTISVQPETPSPQSLLEYSGIKIDRKSYLVYQNNISISLPKKEFELLYLLMSNVNQVCTREDILEKIWGKEVYIGDRTIDVHIRKLREKLGDVHFQTVKGIGYKFVSL